MKRAIAWMLAVLVATTALASVQARYVRPSDTVTINCDEEQSINKDYTITRDGFIIMQYVGAVRIAGLSENDAANKIAIALVSQHILSKATVALQVDSSKQGIISFTGAVQNSGEIAPQDGLRLSDIVKAAQPQPQADLQNVRVLTAAGHLFMVNFAAYNGKNDVNNPLLLSGDTVFFDTAARTVTQPVPVESAAPQGGAPTIPAPSFTPRPEVQPAPVVQQPTLATPQSELRHAEHGERSVQVLGAVESQGEVPYHEGLTLSEAIREAGGMLRDSDTAHLSIERKVDGQTRSFKADYEDIDRGFAGDIALRDHDIVNVPFRSRNNTGKVVRIGALAIIALILLH